MVQTAYPCLASRYRSESRPRLTHIARQTHPLYVPVLRDPDHDNLWTAPWFFVENYMYRRILDVHGRKTDPFRTDVGDDMHTDTHSRTMHGTLPTQHYILTHSQKVRALDGAEGAFRARMRQKWTGDDGLRRSLHASLWGNKAS